MRILLPKTAFTVPFCFVENIAYLMHTASLQNASKGRATSSKLMAPN
jgi:hypothetical protein